MAMTRVAGGLQLLHQSLPGKQQAVAFAIALLLAGRERGTGSLPQPQHFLLLLLYRLTLPAAGHGGHLTRNRAYGVHQQISWCESGEGVIILDYSFCRHERAS